MAGIRIMQEQLLMDAPYMAAERVHFHSQITAVSMD
jgi:hypothetical protein